MSSNYNFMTGGICSPRDYPEFHDDDEQIDEDKITCAYCEEENGLKKSREGELICEYHWEETIDN